VDARCGTEKIACTVIPAKAGIPFAVAAGFRNLSWIDTTPAFAWMTCRVFCEVPVDLKHERVELSWNTGMSPAEARSFQKSSAGPPGI